MIASMNSFDEITGSGATVQATTNIRVPCNWIQVIAPTGNMAVVRMGDSSTTSARGLPLAPGSGLGFPHKGPLAGIYFYIANNDKVDFACAN